MSQMNVRINDDIRREGNAAFADIGWSPSQAVRTIWEFAAHRRKDREALLEMKHLVERGEGDRTTKSKTEECEHIVRDGLAVIGVDASDFEAVSLDDLKMEAFHERWESRGLI